MTYETRTLSVRTLKSTSTTIQMKVLELYFYIILYFLFNSVEVYGSVSPNVSPFERNLLPIVLIRMWHRLLYSIQSFKKVQTFSGSGVQTLVPLFKREL